MWSLLVVFGKPGVETGLQLVDPAVLPFLNTAMACALISCAARVFSPAS
jgi:hypothetical protein